MLSDYPPPDQGLLDPACSAPGSFAHSVLSRTQLTGSIYTLKTNGRKSWFQNKVPRHTKVWKPQLGKYPTLILPQGKGHFPVPTKGGGKKTSFKA